MDNRPKLTFNTELPDDTVFAPMTIQVPDVTVSMEADYYLHKLFHEFDSSDKPKEAR
jgi:hypothetical protein